MDTSYATFIYNHLPNAEDIAPADICIGTKFTHHKLKYIHAWGCPVYVLYPMLQQGCKLMKWKPRSHCGIFVGFSTNSSSDVILILNTATVHIPQ